MTSELSARLRTQADYQREVGPAKHVMLAAADALDAIEPVEEWSTMPYGVFGPQAGLLRGKESALAYADRVDQVTAVKRRTLTIAGEKFSTDWERVWTEKQQAERAARAAAEASKR